MKETKEMSVPAIKAGLGGFPTVERIYSACLSWKRVPGVACIEFRTHNSGVLEITASETPEAGRGGKEVMLHLTPEYVEALKRLLNGGEIEYKH